MIPLPYLEFYGPSEHDIFCTYEVNQMPMLFFLLLPRTGRAVSVKIIYTNCFRLMENQSLHTVFFISGAWILREIVKYNWYHMLFIVFHMKESWFSVDHRIMLWHCAKSSNSKVTCDEGTVSKIGIACIISLNWRFISVCLSKPSQEIFWGFSTVYKARPCKLLEQVQENVQIFIAKQQDYKTLSFQRVHYIRAKPVASATSANVNNYKYEDKCTYRTWEILLS